MHGDFWKPGDQDSCWVCGELTEYAYLDIGWQHQDCDEGPGYRIVRGERQYRSKSEQRRIEAMKEA